MTAVTISLAKLNKARNLIEQKVIPQLEEELISSLRATILIIDNVDAAAAKLANKSTDADAIKAKLESAEMLSLKLREIVAEANAKANLNELLAMQSLQKRSLARWRKIKDLLGPDPALTARQIVAQIQEQKELATANAYIRPNAAVSAVINNDNFNPTAAKNMVEVFENLLRNLDEQRNEINYKTTVSLDEPTATALRSFSVL